MLNLKKTWDAEDNNLKRNFFLASGIVYGGMFLSTPFIAVLALVLSPWVQAGVVNISVVVINSLVFGASCLLFTPNIATDVFKISSKKGNFGDDVSGYANL